MQKTEDKETFDIDMRSEDQLKKARIDAFLAELKTLQDKHKMDFEVALNYSPTGILPVISIKERDKPEVKPE